MTNAELIERFSQPCVMLEKKRVPDGLGGFETSWADGDEFDAAIVKDQSRKRVSPRSRAFPASTPSRRREALRLSITRFSAAFLTEQYSA